MTTGGPLNRLYGKSRASDPSESVHVMSLIRQHEPETPGELQWEIRHHHETDCLCGIDSGGTIEDFGEWLYEAQFEEWGEERFSTDECVDWIYDLFVTQSLKGHDVERQAKQLFENSFRVEDVSDRGDSEYHVDFLIYPDDDADSDAVAGIQVKPESYREVRQEVKQRVEAAHADIDGPIYYLFYEYDEEEFVNSESVMCDVYELTQETND